MRAASFVVGALAGVVGCHQSRPAVSRPTAPAGRIVSAQGVEAADETEGASNDVHYTEAAAEPASAREVAAPAYGPELPPLPAPPRRDPSKLRPRSALPPSDCPPETAWSGLACVTPDCDDESRFEIGFGCVSCPPFSGCSPNPERVPVSTATTKFDRGGARAAIDRVDLSMCKRGDGPVGHGEAHVTFHPAGVVSTVKIKRGPFNSTLVGGCIVRQLAAVQIAPFAGSYETVSREFAVY